jgi:RinA family phage transcriptional activator
MTTTRIKKATFKHIESELYSYKDTLNEIRNIRQYILSGANDDDREEINIVKGANSVREPGDPTGRVATRLVSHKKLNRLEEITNAIEKVYTNLPDTHQELIKLKYWTKPQTLTWDGIAEELSVGRATAFRWRDEIIYALAEVIGWR